MTDEPKYIITETQLKRLTKNGVSKISEQIAFAVLTYPLTYALKAERDNVCNEAIRAIKVIGVPFGTEALFIQTIESLRSEP